MEGYLGQVPVDPKDLPARTPFDLAMMYIEAYGQIAGDHHKLWVLDQVARIYHGTPVVFELAKWSNGEEELRFTTGEPSDAYKAWVLECRGEFDEEEGEYEYCYDEGIPP